MKEEIRTAMQGLPPIRRKSGTESRLDLVVHDLKDGALPVLAYAGFLRGETVSGEKLSREEEPLRGFFTTRLGGASDGMYATMNLSLSRGDAKEHVLENYRRVAEALGTDTGHIVLTYQIHGTKILRVGREEAGAGLAFDRPWDDVDGIITDVPGLALGTFFADCVPLQFYDPVHGAIGACHSGWRGTVGRIGAKCLQAMAEAFGSKPEDCLCAIGPSICQDCYEVSEDVAAQFREAFPGYEAQILIDKGNGHSQLDLWSACRITLEEAGVLPDRIYSPDVCTCCNPSWMFSHRASKGNHGNFGGFLMMPEKKQEA